MKSYFTEEEKDNLAKLFHFNIDINDTMQRYAVLNGRVKQRKHINQRLKHQYKLTEEEYKTLLKNQKNRCKICKRKFKKKGSCRICIDHCSIINKVRGLLCHNCNVGIGHLKHNIKLLINAIKYLEKFENKYPDLYKRLIKVQEQKLKKIKRYKKYRARYEAQKKAKSVLI